MDLVGTSDFDGAIDYRVKAGRLARRVADIAALLPPEAREVLNDVAIDDLPALAEVRVTGTIENPIVTPVAGPAGAKAWVEGRRQGQDQRRRP